MIRNADPSPILTGRQVRLASHPIMVSDKPMEGTPHVTFRREGNLIKEIQIRCACGETIVLDCLYGN